MKLKRRVALALALSILSASVALAASFETGSFSGKTGQKVSIHGKLITGTVSFHVHKGSLSGVVWGVRQRCSDGGHETWIIRTSGSLGKNGRFSYTFATPGHAGQNQFSGKVSGSKASGTLRRFQREDAFGNESPNGVLTCDSGRVKWTANKH